jgi:hypothetical protein
VKQVGPVAASNTDGPRKGLSFEYSAFREMEDDVAWSYTDLESRGAREGEAFDSPFFRYGEQIAHGSEPAC